MPNVCQEKGRVRAKERVFYRLIQELRSIKIPEDTGDFRLLSRRAVDSLRQLREQHRIFNEMKGRPLYFVKDYYAAISQDDGNEKCRNH